MRILHLISSGGLFGAERVVIELSKGLKLLDHCESIVGVIKNSHNPHIEIINEVAMSDIRSVVFGCKFQLDPKLIFSIRKFVRRNQIDLVHCHGYKSNFYGLLACKSLVPTVTTNHNWLKSHWKLKVYCLLDALWIRHFDRIVAVSDGIEGEMLAFKIPKEKIAVIDNGINTERFENVILTKKVKEQFGFGEHIRVIGTVGTLKIEKGHIYLLRVAREIINKRKDVHFLIVGDGPLKKSLEENARNMGIEKCVMFAGQRNDIPELISIMDVFILPSIKEGLPMVLLEAMASKKPVIATKVGGIAKVVKHNESGILVEPGDIHGMQEAVLNLLNEPERRTYMALTGFERVKGDFSSAGMCKKYLSIYKQLTS